MRLLISIRIVYATNVVFQFIQFGRREHAQ